MQLGLFLSGSCVCQAARLVVVQGLDLQFGLFFVVTCSRAWHLHGVIGLRASYKAWTCSLAYFVSCFLFLLFLVSYVFIVVQGLDLQLGLFSL